MTNARVAIAGGSLGGLTAALLLRDLGCEVTVYERSNEELRERGAGIGFLPDSARYLTERVGISMDELATSTDVIRYLDRHGQVVHERHHRYHFSSWTTVYRRLLDAFGRERYELASEVVDAALRGDAVTVALADGRTSTVELLVCADGVGSAFRQRLVPSARRQYSGYVAWRGIVAESALPREVTSALGDAISYHVLANSHILVYPIPAPDGTVTPGRRSMNFVWYRNYLAGDDLDDLLTDASGEHREISLPPGAARPEHVAEVRASAEARLPPVLAAVVHAVEQPFLQVIYDVEVTHMAFGRICLIGDAAWVGRPHAAAGTAKAAADAWALADAMATHATVPEALSAWEPGQMALGRQLLERTRRLGRRSQVTCTWDPADPDVLFRLREEGP